MRLDIFKEAEARLPRKSLHKLLDSIAAKEKKAEWRGSVSIIFVTDVEIAWLNKRYRSRNRATDVLSFNIDEDPRSDDSTFGEIYISVPTARRQAESYGASLSKEILRLACHGMLHLFGYDHTNDEDTRQMQDREEHFLGAL